MDEEPVWWKTSTGLRFHAAVERSRALCGAVRAMGPRGAPRSAPPRPEDRCPLCVVRLSGEEDTEWWAQVREG